MNQIQEINEKPIEVWYDNPKGWLTKSSFSNKLNKPAARGGIFRSFSSKAVESTKFKKRWFDLNIEKRHLAYFIDSQTGNKTSVLAKGYVDMSQIIDIQRSKDTTAPPFSIDLISSDKCFTLAAKNLEEMVRWAYAFNVCRTINMTLNKAGEQLYLYDLLNGPTHLYSKIEVTYPDAGPLLLNVVGTSSGDQSIRSTSSKTSTSNSTSDSCAIVIFFETTSCGHTGRSEAFGTISVNDYLIGVNGTNLTPFNFNDTMDMIHKASFPKTLQFLRDTSENRKSLAEDWVMVFYTSMDKKGRRFVSIQGDQINFYKPSIRSDGAMDSEINAFVLLDDIVSMRPIMDRNQVEEEQFILKLILREGASIEHVDNEIHSYPDTFIDLYLAKENQLKVWRSALVSPRTTTTTASALTKTTTSSTISSTSTSGSNNNGIVLTVRRPITYTTPEIIESDVDMLNKDFNLAILNTLTGQYAPREFTLIDGCIHWVKLTTNKQFYQSKKSLELISIENSECFLRTVRAVEVPASFSQIMVYRFHLILETGDRIVTIGMRDELSLINWLGDIKKVLQFLPTKITAKVVMSNQIERNFISIKGEVLVDGREEVVSDKYTIPADTSEKTVINSIQGYLFKKNNTILIKTSYQKLWFVLNDNILSWYRNGIEVRRCVYSAALVLLLLYECSLLSYNFFFEIFIVIIYNFLTILLLFILPI